MTRPSGEPPAPAQQPEYVEHVSRFNAVAAALGAIAAVLGVLALFVLDWYRDFDRVTSSGTGTTFNDLHKGLDGAHGTNGFSFGISPTYFGWLGYVLIAVAVVAAIGAAATAAGALRAVTAVVSVAGLALTLWAIRIYTFDAPPRRYVDGVPDSGYLDWLKRTSFGAWAMLLAFALCLVAALLRPRRQRSRGY